MTLALAIVQALAAILAIWADQPFVAAMFGWFSGAFFCSYMELR